MQFPIDLNTGNRFWTPKGLGALGMDPNRAIAELVANSLDWRRLNADKIMPVIQVYISKKSIEVRDNGIGMTVAELQNAIQVSVSNDKVRTSLRIRKGMFGMGMKVACLSLGWKISIHTRALTEKNKENILILDTRKLDVDGLTTDYRRDIEGSSDSKLLEGPLKDWESGTSIFIEDLTHRSLTAIAVRDSLQEVFSPEINVEGISIEVIDLVKGETYLCEKINVPVYDESVIRLDDLDLFLTDDITGEKQKITGWLGLMKSGASGTGKWGLHLFKNNQIIERFHQLPSRLGGLMPKNPHPNYARTYGEIHLDMCTPAFHKVGFDYSKSNWKKAAELLAPHIKMIMDASAEFRVGNYEKSKETIIKIQKHKRAIKKVLSRSKKSNKNFSKDAPDNAIQLKDGRWFTIIGPIIDKIANTEKNRPWIYYYRTESRELAIVINENSPIYNNLITTSSGDDAISLLMCWAISDCILLLLCEHFEYSINNAIAFRDEQLIWLTNERVVSDAG